MRSNYIDLPRHFALKTYSLIPITWSTSKMQQPLIALMNTFKPHWRDEGLQPKIQKSW